MIKLQDLDTSLSTPCTGGVLRKWTTKGASRIVKTSTLSLVPEERGVEAIVECIVSDLLSLVGITHTEYELQEMEYDSGVIQVSVCKNYRDLFPKGSCVSAYTLMLALGIPVKDVESRFDRLCEYAPTLMQPLKQMIIADYMIDNPDRHLWNYEFYNTNTTLGLVPLYDHGGALLSAYRTDNDLKALLEPDVWFQYISCAKTQSECFGFEQRTQLRYLLLDDLRFLNIDFHERKLEELLKPYSSYLSDMRRECIYKLILKRRNNLLNLL